jgi:hypothetical protein
VDSRERVLAMRQRLLQAKPADEETARALQPLVALLPLMAKLLPDDPAELDQYLKLIAWGAASCRSDAAAPLQVFEWDSTDPSAPGWRAVEFEHGD